MSRTIHGKSTASLKHLRSAPAALAVYWCYVARMNNEGVAWPSANGLAKDTGWDKNTCLNGRALLIELGALERVESYSRPEWKTLDLSTVTRLKNFDKSEYYRPTGKLIVDGIPYPMLYNGSDDVNPIDSDIRHRLTSDGTRHQTAPDVRSGRTELNSSVGKKNRSTSTTAKKQKDYAQHDALIDAWSMACGYDTDKMGATFNDGTRRKVAEKMLGWNIPATPDEVRKVCILKHRKGVEYEFRYLLDDIPMARAHNHLEAKSESRRGARPEDSINYYLPPSEETQYTIVEAE